MRRIRRWAITAAGLGWAGAALAGMPNITLGDAASLRLSGISFFVALLLLAAWGFQKIWNVVRADFPSLPHFTFRRALAFTLLLGLLLNVVLLMIAGTRELMTPGAWEKSGVSYKLKGPPVEPAAPRGR